MRDKLEHHLRRLLRDRAAAVSISPFSVKKIKQRAYWLVLWYVVAALILAGGLVALAVVD